MQRITAAILLITLLPLISFILILSLIIQGRPLFFLQSRLGVNRTIFKIIKLRTMKDGNITSFGRLLRKTGADEIPQLLNIIKGDMAFIGPRPLTEEDVIRLGWDNSDFDIRWSRLPGITGLSQVSGKCCKDNTWKLDSDYCKNYRPALDLKIVFLTILRLVKGKGDVR